MGMRGLAGRVGVATGPPAASAPPDQVWRVDQDDLPTLNEAINAAPSGRRRAD